MYPNIIVFLLISAIAIAEAVAQYCIKKSRTKDCSFYFFIGVLCYAVVSILLYYSFEHKTMPVTNILWNAFSIVLIIGVGMYFYHESLTTFDWIGLFFVTIGTVLIFYQGHE